jgi:dimethylaniline monooxygenase (N-oxide forming)
VALKDLREEGFEAVGFDRNDYVGGLWHFDPGNKLTVMKCTDPPTQQLLAVILLLISACSNMREIATVSNGSKQRGCFTDFPFPDGMYYSVEISGEETCQTKD